MFEQLQKEVEYAKKSKNKELLYQAYGSIIMAFKLEAITKDEYFELNTMCVRDGINNAQLFKESPKTVIADAQITNGLIDYIGRKDSSLDDAMTIQSHKIALLREHL